MNNDQNPLLGALGLCRKAGKLLHGYDRVQENALRGKVALVLLTSDAHRLISLYFQMIKGKITPEELDDLEDVAALQGIAHVPARVKCAVLAWHTLEEALDGEGKTDKVTTEEEA